MTANSSLLFIHSTCTKARPIAMDSDLWSVLLTLVAFLYFAVLLFSGFRKKYNLPPGPPKWPIVGNMLQLLDLRKPPHQVAAKLLEKYGPIMLMKIGARNLVFVNSPEIAVEILKVQDRLFANRPLADNLAVKKYMTYGESHFSITSHGEYHSFCRKFVHTQLMSQKKLLSFQAMRIEEQNLIVREAFEACSSAPKEPVNLRQLALSYGLNVITRMAFSKKFFGLDPNRDEDFTLWRKVIPDLVHLFGAFLVEDAIPALKWIDVLTGLRGRMQSTFDVTNTLLQKIVEEYRQRLDGLTPTEMQEFKAANVMELILSLNQREDGRHVTDDSIKAIVLDLIVAGSETTSVTTDWMFTEMLLNPDVMKKAQEEVDAVVGRDRCVHESDASQFPYLAAVFKETLRLHPAAPWLIPHTNVVDCMVGGYDIPANSIINVDVGSMHRNPLIWENPLKFDPDRFIIGKYKDLDAKGGNAEFLPFGTGRRICAGMSMAYVMVLPFIARYIHSFDLSLPSAIEELDMSEEFGTTVKRAKELLAIMTPRLAHHLYKV